VGGRFDEVPYPTLALQDFAPGGLLRVTTYHAGRTVVIGDQSDAGLQLAPALVMPGARVIDVIMHGLPGRFIDRLGGRREVPASVVVALLLSVGAPRGAPLRLLTCHAAEAPLHGPAAAQALSTEWGGPVQAPDGLLVIRAGQLEVHVVEWDQDPVTGGMAPSIIGHGQGNWVTSWP
jgi:hypothetical protein